MRQKGVRVLLVWVLWGGMNTSFAFEPNEPPAPTFQTQVLPEETIIQRRQVWHFWQMLQVGLPPEKVTELLGEPLEKETSEAACIWYYQQVPQRLPSGQIQRPRSGFLNFRKVSVGGQEQLLLKLWRQPDWNQMPAFSAEQFEWQQKRLEQIRLQQAAEQQRLEEQKRQAELRRQEELRQQQLQQQLLAQQSVQSQPSRFTLNWKEWPQSYWYAAGGILAGLVVLFIVFKKPFGN